jgi:hypothetical protein
MSKSCKLIVVMVGGVLILGKKYQLREYSCALAVITGLFVFQSHSTHSGSSSFYGIVLLLLSLGFDSVSSNYNEKMVTVNKHVLLQSLSLQLCSIISFVCRCNVLEVFAITNFIACIMCAVAVVASGALSLLPMLSFI